MAKIIVEGWRFLPHSFATVNQFILLELLRHGRHELYHRDVPYWNTQWKPVAGLLDKAAEQLLRQIPSPLQGMQADVTLRTGCPFDLSRSDSQRTVVFATCEFGRLSNEVLADAESLGRPLGDGVSIFTPSRWSCEGLVRSGIDAGRVDIVPHGIDPGIFHPPSGEERQALRKRFGWDGHFIFLHIGAMTPNKGIPAILRALSKMSGMYDSVRLVLKGLDSLYASTAALTTCLEGLPVETHADIRSRVAYTSGDKSYSEIADMYKAADAYVAPYLGEGFNLPVLEASACGLPVVCTGGGSTDDFTTSDFCKRIRSRRVVKGDQEIPDMVFLQPEQEHLLAQMQAVVQDERWREQARVAGPEYVLKNYTWETVIDDLQKVMFNES